MSTPSLRPLRLFLVSAGIFSAAINLLLLSVPLYSLQVFSRAIPTQNINTLAMLTAIAVFALTLMAVLDGLRARLCQRAANQLESSFRPLLLAEALRAGARRRGDPSPLGDFVEARGFLTRPGFTALADLPWTPFYLIGISLIHPLFAGLMGAAIVLLVLLALFGDAATRGFLERGRQWSQQATRLGEALTGRADSARALGLAAAVGRWRGDNDAAVAEAGTAAERAASVAAAAKWVRLLLQIAVTGFGAVLVIDNQLSLGGMIATSLLVGRGLAPVEQATAGWSGILKAIAAWRRTWPHLRRLSTTAAGDAAPAAGSGRLEVEGLLYMSPRDQRPLLRQVGFVLEPGELLCVFGNNRSGKSVLAKLLSGELLANAGSIRLEGAAPGAAIGYVPQEAVWFPGTLGENIARFRPDGLEQAVEAARRVGAHEAITALPAGYDTELGASAAELTGGLERLAALARAAVGSPRLLVLDEPAAHLDAAGVERVRRFLAEAKANGTIIVLLSLQSTFIDLADKVLVLNNGLVAAYGPKDKVIQPVQRRMSAVPKAEAQPVGT